MTEREKLDRITKINKLKSHTITKPINGLEALEGYTIQYATPEYIYKVKQPPELIGFILVIEKDGHTERQTFRFTKSKE